MVIFAKTALLNLCIRFKFLARSSLLKHYENGNKKKKIHNMFQVPPNPGFMQEEVQKGDFLQKLSRELIFFFVVVGSYESLEGLDH